MSQLHIDTDRIKVVDAVEEGVELCRLGEWKTGLQLLWKAARHEGEEAPDLPARYYSFLGYGVALTQRRLADGLRLCIHGVKLDREDPECWLNLARVYALRSQRRKTITAIGKGLAISPDHPELLELEHEIGKRLPPVLAFLPRSHRLNRWLGERRHERLLAKAAEERERRSRK